MTATARLVLAIFVLAMTAPAAAQQATSSKAIYYTQARAESVPASAAGSAVWRRVEQEDGTAAIEARIEFADPPFAVTITVSRNTDTDVPASHLIEVAFEDVGNVSEIGIERIPALVAKPGETARGKPFIGAGVAVTDRLFWIGLSGKTAENNVALLRAGEWFDMPILFRDQTRALISFETGPFGREVFDEVLATWPERAASAAADPDNSEGRSGDAGPPFAGTRF